MTIVGAAKVDINRRVPGAAQYLEDRTDTACVYYGVTPFQDTLTSQPKWQIWRVENVNGVLHTRFANQAKYDQIWDDRATLFPACAGTDPIWPPTEGTFTGEIITSGLTIAGLMTVVPLNAATWVALPPASLPNRNTIAIQNQSGIEIKYNYDNTEPGYVGTIIAPGGERFINITDSIPVYAKASAGTPSIMVEEIS